MATDVKRVAIGQVWEMNGVLIVVVVAKLFGPKCAGQSWWTLLDLETGFTFHFGDNAFNKNDVLIYYEI